MCIRDRGEGVGVAVGEGVGVAVGAAHIGCVIWLLSNVTCCVSEMARPTKVAPVANVMEPVLAIIVPSTCAPVPIVMEVEIAQKTLLAQAPLIKLIVPECAVMLLDELRKI